MNRKRRRRLKSESDGAVARGKSRARTCIATGVCGPPDLFVRFVLAPDGSVIADLNTKLPGRGAWVTASRQAIEVVSSKGLFARAFKCAVKTPPDLVGTVEAGLEKKALAALGLARRTGDVAVGFDQVRALLKEGHPAVYVSAADGAEDGFSKLAKLAGQAVIVRAFDGYDLSSALGRDDVVHAALKKGAAAERFLREARRLDGFRPVFTATPAGNNKGSL